jgi:hypothetical protein
MRRLGGSRHRYDIIGNRRANIPEFLGGSETVTGLFLSQSFGKISFDFFQAASYERLTESRRRSLGISL